MTTPTRPSLSALTAAALALPGLAQADVQTDYLYSHYQEADLPSGRAASGRSSERYTIDSHLFRVVAPFGEQTLSVNATYETMSGASPWWVQPDADGRPVQVMSGASIEEERADVQASWSLPFADLDWSASLGYSTEDDYEAINGGIESAYTPPHGQYTVSGGLGYSYDRLDPVVGASSTDVIDTADKDSVSAYGGVSWIVDAQTVLQTALSYTLHDGYLSDPYKRAFIVEDAGTVRDARPDRRALWALSARLRHYVGALGGALHVDYRYFHDDWKIEAHTLEVAWNQVIADSWRLTPALRWYSQSQAYFYAPYYASARGDGLASSDYRLSPYGALSLRVDLRKALGDWELGAGAEWYDASAGYAIGSVDVANPGLVDYLVLNLRLARRF
ncbi:DUF3570 domain-containing protein [Fontimonas sp. SYSU GA230001]|uniref:DUF3570 domain-containing protein n=1 Tax=Fontimonas sp. SYSU GA230001 TaxID=3142450 RepID=UPI0032B4A7EA